MTAALIHWSNVTILDAETNAVDVDDDTRIKLLSEYKDYETITDYFLDRTDSQMAEEFDDRAADWGPSIEEIDWHGFSEARAWRAAIDEGLAYFLARMHVGHTVAFVASNWEEGGFSVNGSGDPIADVRQNTVASFGVEVLNSENKSHIEQVAEWYG